MNARRSIVADTDGISYVRLVKYLSLRLQNVSTDRGFLRYVKGKGTNQVLGVIHLDRVPCNLHVILNWTILRNTRDMRFDVRLLPLSNPTTNKMEIGSWLR